MANASSNHEYLAIDLVRGLSAFAVLVWHYQAFYFVDAGGPPIFAHRSDQPFYSALSLFYNYGALAVPLFWAISGFVFTTKYVQRRKTAREFFVARFSRLYPLHFLTLLVVAGIQLVSMELLGKYQVYPYNDLYHFVLNIFFAPAWGLEKGFSFNSPIWSVSVEVVIYATFFVSIPLVARLRIVAPLAIMAASYFIQRHIPQFLFWQCGYYFYLGVFLYQACALIGRWSWAAGLALLACWAAFGYGSVDRFGVLAIPCLFSAILVICSAIDKHRIARPALQKLSWVGESTYSTYLWHMPVIMVATTTFALTGANRTAILNQAWFFVAFMALVFVLARLSYRYIEIPSQSYIRRKWLAGSPSLLTQTTTAT